MEFVVPMLEFSNLTSSGSEVQLDFVERKATPRELMRLSIQLHLFGLSLSDTVSALEGVGVEWVRSTVHNWGFRKLTYKPTDGNNRITSHLTKPDPA
ncbi:hypothetical protein JCM18750_23760 [Halostagnicola bangensis]